MSEDQTHHSTKRLGGYEIAGQIPSTPSSNKKPFGDGGADAEMKDAPEEKMTKATDASEATVSTAKEDNKSVASADAGGTTPSSSAVPASTPADKSQGRHKSTGGTMYGKRYSVYRHKMQLKEGRRRRMGIREEILHLDAKPGDHFIVIGVKGIPTWPVIVCSEDMLSAPMIRSRPVTAAREDRTYRQDFADGGKQAHKRKFPVLYLGSNEFGWVANSDLHAFDPSKIMDALTDKMGTSKVRVAAHKLASEQHPLEFYQALLATPQAIQVMADAEAVLAEKQYRRMQKLLKRNAKADDKTRQRTESVKPKINPTTTPKAGANTLATVSKGSKDSNVKTTKSKAKKPSEKEEAPKDVELSPEEEHARLLKQVMGLRSKLQKGLLMPDKKPKEDEMATMSECLTHLESLPDLGASIIKTTKIDKVLRKMLRLESIPKEKEFHFKPRAQAMLDKWNKIVT